MGFDHKTINHSGVRLRALVLSTIAAFVLILISAFIFWKINGIIAEKVTRKTAEYVKKPLEYAHLEDKALAQSRAAFIANMVAVASGENLQRQDYKALTNDLTNFLKYPELSGIIITGTTRTIAVGETKNKNFLTAQSYCYYNADDSIGRVEVFLDLSVKNKKIKEAAQLLQNNMAGLEKEIKEGISIGLGAELFLIILLGAFWLGAVLVYLKNKILIPIDDCVAFAGRIKEGDFTGRIAPGGINETARLKDALSDMAVSLDSMFRDILTDIETLSFLSIELNAISQKMFQGVEVTASRSTGATTAVVRVAENIRSIATSAEEVGAQIKSVAGSFASVSANMGEVESETKNVTGSVNTVAESIEIMRNALGKISTNSVQVARETEEASVKADNTWVIVNDLDKAAREVSEIIDMITDIALDTHILSLNAAVQATAAGTYGSRFRVVADEVKKLAKQTAEASVIISKKIEGMQNNTGAAINAINTIVKAVAHINDLTTAISENIGEQTSTINDVFESAEATAIATQAVSKNVEDSALEGAIVSQNLDEVAKAMVTIAQEAIEASAETDRAEENVKGVDEAADLTFEGANHIKTQSEHLKSLSRDLQVVFGKFKVKER